MQSHVTNQAEWSNRTNWKLGMFYCSRSDTRYIVPKRLHLGWTFNFGRLADATGKPLGRMALLWSALGALATVAVMPYLLTLNPAASSSPIPLPLQVTFIGLGSFLNLLAFCWLGLRLGIKPGLSSPIAEALCRGKRPAIPLTTVFLSLLTGLVGGALIVGLDVVLQPFMPAPLHGPGEAAQRTSALVGLLASFYGGINEELTCRLVLMTLLVWLFSKIFSRRQPRPAALVYVLSVVIAALLFGAGHLPLASTLWPLTGFVVFKIVLLNTILGIACGLIFWKHGLEYAMIAHFGADIVLHVLSAM